MFYRKEIEDSIQEKLTQFLGVEKFRPELRALEKRVNPQAFKRSKIITVGGTNGKGETIFRLEQALLSMGYKVSSWSSPHVISLRERFKHQGSCIGYEDLERRIDEYLPHREGLSYYEFLFWIFVDWASQFENDYILLEVGLGGRWDGVNIFSADLSMITNISRDHIGILGNSYKKILHEKLGITRKGVPLVTSIESQYLLKEIRYYCTQNQIPWKNIETKTCEFYFQKNFQLVLEGLKALGLDIKSINPERLAQIPRVYDRSYILEGREQWFLAAHNLDGIRKTVCWIQKALNPKKLCLTLSFSLRPEQEIIQILTLLKEEFPESRIQLTFYHHPKACPEKDLREISRKQGISFIKSWKDFKEGQEHQLYLGSIYFLSEILRSYCVDPFRSAGRSLGEVSVSTR